MKIQREVEDSALQAGWIFADLFLALTVIFLATVSYIPSNTGPNSNNNSTVKATDSSSILKPQIALISNGFIGEYQVTNVGKFVKNFETYLNLKDLPSNSKAIYIEAIGHTSAYGAANDQGTLDALKFVIEIRKELSENFEGVSSSINLSPDVASGYVKIKVTFV